MSDRKSDREKVRAALRGLDNETVYYMLDEAVEMCFRLLRHIDECLDDIVFFADEAGSWQVGVDWAKVLRAWFVCLSATTKPADYACRVVELVDEFAKHDRKKHLMAARRAATPAQRKALSGPGGKAPNHSA